MPVLFWLISRRRRRTARPVPPSDTGLRVCADCHAHFVVPVDYQAVDDGHWWMRLRCGQCGGVRELVVAHDDAQRYDRELAQDMATIVAALGRDPTDAFDGAASGLNRRLR